MQAAMLYFSGSGIQIFSLGTIFMLLTNPFASILGIRKSQLQLREEARTDRQLSSRTDLSLSPRAKGHSRRTRR